MTMQMHGLKEMKAYFVAMAMATAMSPTADKSPSITRAIAIDIYTNPTYQHQFVDNSTIIHNANSIVLMIRQHDIILIPYIDFILSFTYLRQAVVKSVSNTMATALLHHVEYNVVNTAAANRMQLPISRGRFPFVVNNCTTITATISIPIIADRAWKRSIVL